MILFALSNPELLTQLGIFKRFGLNLHNDYLTDASDAHYQMKPSLGINIPPRDGFAHPT